LKRKEAQASHDSGARHYHESGNGSQECNATVKDAALGVLETIDVAA
jgi:hypothetical protein